MLEAEMAQISHLSFVCLVADASCKGQKDVDVSFLQTTKGMMDLLRLSRNHEFSLTLPWTSNMGAPHIGCLMPMFSLGMSRTRSEF